MMRLHRDEEVTLNVTAMLDMAFQLLAFFVLTFRPAPTEPAIELHLPPAKPMVTLNPDAADPGPKLVNPADVQPAGVDTLHVDLFSTSGALDRIAINDSPVASLDDLRDKLTTLLGDPSSAIKQVVVQADEPLQYALLMEVVGICSQQKLPSTGNLPKLSLVAMQARE